MGTCCGERSDNLIRLLLTLLIFFGALVLSASYAFAFMTSLSTTIGLPDINNKCHNDNSTKSCFALGVKSGLVAGQEMRKSRLVYSLVGGVGGQHSPNFSYGYLLGFDKGFHKQTIG
jgi:hypothetical protein